MNRRACALAIAAAICTGGPAAGEELGWYAAVRAVGSVAAVSDITNASTGADAGSPLQNDGNTDLVAGPGLAVGYWWGPRIKVPIRTELEYVLRYRFDYDNSPFTFLTSSTVKGLKSNIQTHSVLLNILYDIETGTRILPYVGFGVGYARTEADSELTNKTANTSQSLETGKDNFAWSVNAGFLFQLSKHWGLEAGYRYIDLGGAQIGRFSDGVQVDIDDYTSHDLILGVLYRF